MKMFTKYILIVLVLSAISGCRAFRVGIYEQDPNKARPITAKYDVRDFLSMPAEIVQKILAHPFPAPGAAAPMLVDMGIQNRTKSHLDMQALADTAALFKTSQTFSLNRGTSDDWNFSSLYTSVTTIFDATSPAACPPMPSERTA